MRRLLWMIVVALAACGAFAAFAESPPGDSARPGTGSSSPFGSLNAFGAPDATFRMAVIASSPTIQVLYLQGQKAADQVLAGASYLLVRSGSAAFLQPMNGVLLDTASSRVDRVNAAVVDLGEEPGVVVTVEVSNPPQAGYTLARVYGVGPGTIDALSDPVRLEEREFSTELSATVPAPVPAPATASTSAPAAASAPAAVGWSFVRITEAATNAEDPAPRPVHYLAFDPALKQYAREDYTSQFQPVQPEDLAVQAGQPDSAVQSVALQGNAAAGDASAADATDADLEGSRSPGSDGTAGTLPLYQLGVDRARLRDAAGTQANVLRILTRDTAFHILDRTDGTQTVNGVTERWYRILLKDSGAEGWIFGGVIRRKG